MTNNKKEIKLSGRIDSNNAAQTEQEILAQLSEGAPETVVLDAEDLQYISSAGLRVMLTVQKEADRKISIINLSPEVLEIFRMAGFQYLMEVKGV